MEVIKPCLKDTNENNCETSFKLNQCYAQLATLSFYKHTEQNVKEEEAVPETIEIGVKRHMERPT